MSKLPRGISGRELVRYLTKKGFVVRNISGSHAVMKSESALVTVPLHEELDTGTLLGILERAKINRDDFIQEWRN